MQDESLPGAQLRRAREEKGISREEVSRGLHLSRNYLIALENDEYGKLPEPAFIKGYLRNYARLLGLSGEEVAALYQQRLDRERVSAEEHQAETEERRREANPRWRLPALIVLVVILVLLLGWWLWPGQQTGQSMSDNGHQMESGQVENGQNEEMTPPHTAADEAGDSTGTSPQSAAADTAESAQESAPVASTGGVDGQASVPATDTGSGVTSGATEEAATASGATDTRVTDSDSSPAGEADAATGDSAAAGGESGVQPAVAAPTETGTASTDQGSEAAPAAADDGLAMAFSRECWVKVVDGSGKTLSVGTQQAGAAMDLQGRAPFRVTIGDAGAVSSVVVNGKQINLPSQRSGEVIHVTLP